MPAAFRTKRISTSEQTIAAAATITVDPASGVFARITLSATAITTINAGTGVPGEILTTSIIQDGTGGRSISGWSASWVFAGGAYTVTATLNKRDLITWRWDTVAAKWYEQCQKRESIMPYCTITDVLESLSATATPTPIVGAQLTAQALFTPTFFLVSGIWRTIENQPRVAVTDTNGSFTFVLPKPSESDPNSVQWAISLPDCILQGNVPEVTGPITLHDLKAIYGWVPVSSSPTPVLAIQGSNLFPIYTTATRPSANAVGATASAAVPIWNSDVHAMQVSDGTNWYDVDGNEVG